MNVSMTLLKRIIQQLKKTNQKYVTVDDLSQQLGIYPDKIAEVISFFNPLILMDLTSNLKDHLEQMETFLNSKVAPKEIKKTKISRIDIKAYKSIIDFIYQHMTIDGIIDKTNHLSIAELKAMKKLITEELKSKKTLK
jgi:NADH/NAD ratio-sensing transcriptional regulator Rex